VAIPALNFRSVIFLKCRFWNSINAVGLQVHLSGFELLQIPLPTRHARVSDFVIDFFGASFAIGLVVVGDKFLMRSSRSFTGCNLVHHSMGEWPY